MSVGRLFNLWTGLSPSRVTLVANWPCGHVTTIILVMSSTVSFTMVSLSGTSSRLLLETSSFLPQADPSPLPRLLRSVGDIRLCPVACCPLQGRHAPPNLLQLGGEVRPPPGAVNHPAHPLAPRRLPLRVLTLPATSNSLVPALSRTSPVPAHCQPPCGLAVTVLG